MIVQENFAINGRKYVHTYSDSDRYIIRDGFAFVEAYDPEDFHREYSEGDAIIHTLEDFEALELLVSVCDITYDKAVILRHMIETASAFLTDAEALEAVELFPNWQTDTAYALGIRVRYDGQLYRCEQAHTSQADWTPDVTRNLWTPVAEPHEIPVWQQPTGAQDAYRIGDKVHFPTADDPVYVSVIDYNTYAPNVYGWELYQS